MTSVKSLQKQLLAAVAMVLVAAIAMSSATYAWFVNNATVTATNVNVKASTAFSLLISQTNDENSVWGTTTALDAGVGSLTPVSTIGDIYQAAKESGKDYTLASKDEALDGITLSAATDDAAAVGKGDDTKISAGDVRFVTSTSWDGNYVNGVTEVSKSSTVGDDKYFYTETVYLKAAQEGDVYLDKTGIGIVWAAYDTSKTSKFADAKLISLADFAKLDTIDTKDLSEGTTPKLKEAQEYNEKLTSAQALLKTLRIGLLVTQTGEDTNQAKTYTRTWHEYQLATDAISKAVNTTLASTSGADGITNAVTAVYTDAGDANKTVIATDTKPTVAAISNNVSMSSATIETVALAGSQTDYAKVTDGADKIVSLDVNEVVQVDIYVWMEGCDGDTIAANINDFSGTGVTGLQIGFCLGKASTAA
jgi:hypothetical protein